jgi:hypothetical protein
VLLFERARLPFNNELDSKALTLDQRAGERNHANKTTPSPSALGSHGARHRRTRTLMNQAMREQSSSRTSWSPGQSPSAFSMPREYLDADGCF